MSPIFPSKWGGLNKFYGKLFDCAYECYLQIENIRNISVCICYLAACGTTVLNGKINKTDVTSLEILTSSSWIYIIIYFDRNYIREQRKSNTEHFNLLERNFYTSQWKYTETVRFRYVSQEFLKTYGCLLLCTFAEMKIQLKSLVQLKSITFNPKKHTHTQFSIVIEQTNLPTKKIFKKL